MAQLMNGVKCHFKGIHTSEQPLKSLPKPQDLNRGEKEQGMRRMKGTPGTRTSWQEAQEMGQEIHQVHPLGDRDKKLQGVPKCQG